MKTDDYPGCLKEDCDLVRLLSDKNGARVFLMKNKKTGRKMVLRIYPERVEIYDRLKTLKHENLPLVYDSLQLEDGQAVFEEYVDGITVSQVLENGTYTYGGAKKVLSGVCCALELIHSMGFVHRDIKPENIVIDNGGKVKLIDFNAARRFNPDSIKDTVLLGTLGYAPPEQMGLGQSDRRTDIYALGVLLNVMLTGEHPSRRLAEGRAGRIVLKCTSIDPNARYRTANDLLKSL